MAPPLQNYLRTYRKRAGLSQAEVAFLLGTHSGSKVSRHERFARRPTLEVAIAYEVLFGTPISELFAGIRVVAERDTVARAARLVAELEKPRLAPQVKRKVAHLRYLAQAEQ